MRKEAAEQGSGVENPDPSVRESVGGMETVDEAQDQYMNTI